jgi:hypothetical protein
MSAYIQNLRGMDYVSYLPDGVTNLGPSYSYWIVPGTICDSI